MSNEKFSFKYVAPTEEERKEIASIRKQYVSKEEGESKIDRLRRLDDMVKSPAMMWGLIFGVVGLLIFGLGMTMILEWSLLVWGILVCVVGCVPMGLAYPTYCAVLSRNKQKYGDEIIKLSEELLSVEEETKQS